MAEGRVELPPAEAKELEQSPTLAEFLKLTGEFAGVGSSLRRGVERGKDSMQDNVDVAEIVHNL